jgi:hypothetical protein
MSWACNEQSKLKNRVGKSRLLPQSVSICRHFRLVKLMGSGPPLLASREGNLGDWTAGWIVPLDSEKLYALLKHILCLSEEHYCPFSNNARNFPGATPGPTLANNLSPDVRLH